MIENSDLTNSPMTGMLPLDVLAEVATETLKNDPTLNSKQENCRKSQNGSAKSVASKRYAPTSEVLSLEQIRHLSDKMLLEMFSEHNSDEIRRYFSYKCYLIPEKCEKVFSSFGNEAKARVQMKSHLLSHVTQLIAETQASGLKTNSTFMAEPLNVRQRKQQEVAKKRKKGKALSKKLKLSSSKQPSEKRNCFPKVKGGREANGTVPNNKNLSLVDIKALTGFIPSPAVNGRYPTRLKKSTHSNASIKKVEKENHESYLSPFEKLFRAIQKVDKSFCESIQNDLNAISCNRSEFAEPDEGVAIKKHVNNFEMTGETNGVSGEEHVLCIEKQENLDLTDDAEKGDDAIKECTKDLVSPQDSVKSQPPVQPQHDHTYTSVEGKTYSPESNENLKNIVRLSKEFRKSSHRCSGVPGHLIIPTSPFPYLYVPILPCIAEIKEIGNAPRRSCDKCSQSSITLAHSSRKINSSLHCPSHQNLKPIRMRRANKVVVVEEHEGNRLSREDEENMPCTPDNDSQESKLSNEVVDSEDRFHTCETAVMGLLEKHTVDVTHFGERKLALKCIRALRTKKKDERGPLICQICKDKSFTAQATLMYHYRSHAGIKPFVCGICGATFTRQHSLNYHLLIHDNKSRFACEVCGRHFRHPSHYKEHLRRHTGETPYQCTDCNLRFKTRNTYKRHLKTRHGKILTARGIKVLSLEEFDKVRTCPRRRFSKSSLSSPEEDSKCSENTDIELPLEKSE